MKWLPDSDRLVLPRSVGERVKLVVLCSGFSGFMGFMLTEMDKWKPNGLIEHLIHALGTELFCTIGLFSVLGILWGLFTPFWLERLLQRGFWKVLAVVLVVGVVSIVGVVAFLAQR